MNYELADASRISGYNPVPGAVSGLCRAKSKVPAQCRQLKREIQVRHCEGEA
jgi:hypothetical protein